MNSWFDPRIPPIPEEVLRHCTAVWLTSLALISLILLTLIYTHRRRSRHWLCTAQLALGSALLFAACKPCAEIVLRAWMTDDHESLAALLKATETPTAAAWYGAVCAGLVGLFVLTMRAPRR